MWVFPCKYEQNDKRVYVYYTYIYVLIHCAKKSRTNHMQFQYVRYELAMNRGCKRTRRCALNYFRRFYSSFFLYCFFFALLSSAVIFDSKCFDSNERSQPLVRILVNGWHLPLSLYDIIETNIPDRCLIAIPSRTWIDAVNPWINARKMASGPRVWTDIRNIFHKSENGMHIFDISASVNTLPHISQIILLFSEIECDCSGKPIYLAICAVGAVHRMTDA